MAAGQGAIDYLWFFVAVALGFGASFYFSRRTPRKPKFLLMNEYWVYIPGERMPEQTALMARVLRDNPHKQNGRNPIGHKEGLILSDIRFHMALVLRSKNPHVFRPDLFDEYIEPTAEVLSALADSKALVKVRFISEEPLRDKATVQFLPHMADAVADLGEGRVVYDVVSERLMLVEELREILSTNLDLATPELQVRTIWRKGMHGGKAETKGLVKIGVPELTTGDMEADEEVLVTQLVTEAVRALWAGGTYEEEVEVTLFDDQFRIQLETPVKNVSQIRIMRMQSL